MGQPWRTLSPVQRILHMQRFCGPNSERCMFGCRCTSTATKVAVWVSILPFPRPCRPSRTSSTAPPRGWASTARPSVPRPAWSTRSLGPLRPPPPDPTTTGFCGSGLSAISKFKQQQKSIGRPGQFNLVGAPSFWTDVCVVVIFEALDSNAPGLQKCPKSSIVLIPPKSNNTG